MHIGEARRACKEVLLHLPYTTMLVGETGVGKSQFVQQLAKELQYKYIELRPGQMEPGDLIGMCYLNDSEKNTVTDKQTSWAKPDWWPNGKEETILLIDEFNRGQDDVTQAMFQLVYDRRLHTHVLPDNVHVMASMNPDTSAYNVTPLDDALKDRFIYLYIEPSHSVWLDWAERESINAHTIDFIRKNSTSLAEEKPRHDMELKPTPRSWEMVARVTDFLAPDKSNRDMIIQICNGIVGSAAAMTYNQYLKDVSLDVTFRQMLETMSPSEIKKTLSHTNDKVTKIVNEAISMSDTDITWVMTAKGVWKKYVLFLMELQPELFKQCSTKLHADSRECGEDGLKKKLWKKWTEETEVVMKIADVNDTNVTRDPVKLQDDSK